MYKLSDFYLKGLSGVEQSPKKELELLNCATMQDNESALYRLGIFYRDGKGGLTQDIHKAIEYFTKAESWSSIAEIYKTGQGDVRIDGRKTIDLYNRRVDRLKKLEAPKIILMVELEALADIYETGYGEYLWRT